MHAEHETGTKSCRNWHEIVMHTEHENGNCSSQNYDDQLVGMGVVGDFRSEIVMTSPRTINRNDATSNYQTGV